MGQSAEFQSLRVGIAGAGIAGLGAAIALRRAGHDVELFEKSSFKNEIGAAITMCPNANLILERWGFDAAEARETDKRQCRALDPATNEEQICVKYDGLTERFQGLKFNAFHRVDLHDQLRRLAEAAGATIKLGNKVVDLDCEAGVLRLSDGSAVDKDLVVIADGFRSQFVSQVVEQDVVTHKMGASVYRTLIPMDRLMADPEVRPVFENQPSGFCSARDMAKGVMVITYPCRDDEIMNVAVFHRTKPHELDKEDWNSPATIEDVLDVLDGFHASWSALVRHADTFHCYNLGMRDVLPRVVRGKAVLIGDAAHPMQPTHAQGGCMALEDCAALEVLFSQPGDVRRRLQLFNALRLPRNNVTQILSNGMFYTLVFKLDENALSEKIKQYYDGDIVSWQAWGWDVDVQDFFFWYDAYAQATKAMAWRDDPLSMPRDAITQFGVKSR